MDKDILGNYVANVENGFVWRNTDEEGKPTGPYFKQEPLDLHGDPMEDVNPFMSGEGVLGKLFNLSKEDFATIAKEDPLTAAELYVRALDVINMLKNDETKMQEDAEADETYTDDEALKIINE